MLVVLWAKCDYWLFACFRRVITVSSRQPTSVQGWWHRRPPHPARLLYLAQWRRTIRSYSVAWLFAQWCCLLEMLLTVWPVSLGHWRWLVLMYLCDWSVCTEVYSSIALYCAASQRQFRVNIFCVGNGSRQSTSSASGPLLAVFTQQSSDASRSAVFHPSLVWLILLDIRLGRTYLAGPNASKKHSKSLHLCLGTWWC